MTEQEIVDEWKQNERGYMFLPKEMQEWAKEHHRDIFPLYLNGKTTEVEFMSKNYPDNGRIYRLHPDFELPKEPEFEYLPIKVYMTSCRLRWVYVDTNKEEYWMINEAISIVGFEGYTIDADDSCEPRREFEPKHKFVKIRKEAK